MNLAIIGSREFDEELFFVEMNSLKILPSLRVISGGARGVDTYAEEWCKINNVPIEIIRPINPSDNFSYLLRNVEIITKADCIYAFWDGISKGTKFVIDYAKARGFKEGINLKILTPKTKGE